MSKEKSKNIIISIIIVIYVWALCMNIATNIKFNSAPDEILKYNVCKYIYENSKLPEGGDESIRDPKWGISYAFTPILSYMFSAGIMKIVSLFSQNESALIIGARLVSVFCLIGYTIMCIKISNKLFKKLYKWLFVVFATLLPQVIYLGSYLNNDSLALFSISIIIYSWLIGLEENWSWKSCIILAVGLGICALSYYNAYGYILCSIIIYFVSSYIKKINVKEFLLKGITIALITLLIAGWWFVRSYIIYDGDFLGLNIQRQYGERYAMEKYKPSNRETPANKGYSLVYMLTEMKWIETTIQSFIGRFGYMEIIMKNGIYIAYGAIIGVGIIGAIANTIKKIVKKQKSINKDKKLLKIIMLISIIIPIILSLYYFLYIFLIKLQVPVNLNAYIRLLLNF
ncbi:MAG: ArnT family glycosyltransferase [Clostridia bacterium]